MIFLVVKPHLNLKDEIVGYIAAFTGCIASLAGFVNALIFSLQGRVSNTKYAAKSFVSSYTDFNDDVI